MKILNKNSLKIIVVIFILVFVFIIYNQQNKLKSSIIEINVDDYMKIQELLNKNEIEIDIESYLYCKKAHTAYNDEYGNDEIECDIYTFDINKLIKNVIQESKN